MNMIFRNRWAINNSAITIMTLGVPICERLAAKTGLKREQILLSSSHIHTGPSLSLNPKEREGKATSDEAQRTVEYTRWLQDRPVEVVERSLEKREPARLSWGS